MFLTCPRGRKLLRCFYSFEGIFIKIKVKEDKNNLNKDWN